MIRLQYLIIFLFTTILVYSQNISVEDKVKNIDKRVSFIDSIKIDYDKYKIIHVDGDINTKKEFFLKQKIIGAFFEEYITENDRIVRMTTGRRLFSDYTNTLSTYVFDDDEDLCYYRESVYKDSENDELLSDVEYYFEKEDIILVKHEGQNFISDLEKHRENIEVNVLNIKNSKLDLIDFGK